MFRLTRQLLHRFFPSAPKETSPEAAYDLWAATYDNQPHNLVLALDHIIFSGLLAQVPVKSKTIIDVGCGTGRHWNEILQQEPASLTGYDVSEEMLRVLKQKFPQQKVERLTSGRINQPGNSCDLLISTLALAHIPNMPMTLGEWNRVLKPGGDIIITDYHPVALQKGGNRTFQSGGKTIAVRNYIYPISQVIESTKQLNFTPYRFIERAIDGQVRNWYEEQGALSVFERFEGTPIVYGLHLKKNHVTP